MSGLELMKSLSIKAGILGGLGLMLVVQLAANALTCKVNEKLVTRPDGTSYCQSITDLGN